MPTEKQKAQLQEKIKSLVEIEDQIDVLPDCEYDDDFRPYTGEDASERFRNSPDKDKCVKLLEQHRHLDAEINDLMFGK